MRTSKTIASSVETAAINTYASLVRLGCDAPKRLSRKKQGKLSPADLAAYVEGRQLFLDEWHALIELGVIDPCWSSCSQRLDYVAESAGLEDKKWTDKAEIDPPVVSMLRKRTRGRPNEESLANARHIYDLLRVSGQPVALHWVLGGTWTVDKRKFWDRYNSVLKLEFRENFRWIEAAKAAGYYSNAQSPDPREQKRWATKLANHHGPIIPLDWRLSGQPQPPPRIQAAMVRLHDQPRGLIPAVGMDQYLRPRKVTVAPKILTKEEDREQMTEDYIRKERATLFFWARWGTGEKPQWKAGTPVGAMEYTPENLKQAREDLARYRALESEKIGGTTT